MENKDNSVPYIVYESTLSRLERINKRMVTIIITLILTLLVSNLCWVIHGHRTVTGIQNYYAQDE